MGMKLDSGGSYWKYRLLGYDDSGTPMEIVTDLLIRYSVLGYLVFNAWQGYNWNLFGYNIFLYTGLLAFLIIVIDVILDEEEAG